ncbi:MAG: T9SS type A sorting domain-containing protein [Rhodothermales bacterium]
MKTATRLLALVAMLVPFVQTAAAQTEVTIREINSVPTENLATLQALGIDATQADVDDNITFPLDGQEVLFTAVVLTDPFNSGNASWVDATNTPGRVHVFVRDTTANSEGYAGMTIQIVDGSASVLTMVPGSVYDIIGTVDPFGTTVQISPSVFELVGTYQSLGLPDAIVEPIAVSTDDLNRVVGQDGDGNDLYQANWTNFNVYNNEYVFFDEAVVEASVAADAGRPNFQWRSSGASAVVNSDDISLRYRNDRNGGPGYPNPPYATRSPEDPFVPPSTGAVIQVQGFVSFPTFDFDNDIEPGAAAFTVAPWTDDDLQSLESPPVFGAIQGPDDVPGDAPVTISVGVTQGSAPVASVVLSYESTDGASGDVTLTDDGSGVFSGQVPAVADGAFVTYSITATDTDGDSSTSPARTYRVLFNGIQRIEDIQLTADGGPGASPFAGITTTNIALQGIVMSDVETSGFLTIQDNETLAPWTGIFVEVTVDIAGLGLQPGDRVSVSEATIAENFGVTELQDATLTVTSSGDPYAYKVVPTGVLAQDDATAEAHEGMALRFVNVTITQENADPGATSTGCPEGAGFGEWAFSSDGTEANAIRADDASDAIDCGFNIDTFDDGMMVGAIQGIWTFSFGNYKLLPESADDIMITVDAESDALAAGFALDRAFPNPFSSATKIAFEVGEAGPVSLVVYDVLGREVAVLVDGTLAADRYEADFDAGGLAAGVYVYRLTAGDVVLTGRMTLVK